MARAGRRSEATRLSLQRAALRVAVEYGLRGITHRRVAAEADVALGSASYHYEHIDDLVFEAFSAWVQSQSAMYLPELAGARDDADVIAAVKKMLSVIHGTEGARILLFELYAQSVRDPEYHRLVEDWSYQTRSVLERKYTPRIAQQIEAIWEGIGVQLVMGALEDVSEVETLLRMVLDPEPVNRTPSRS